MAIVVDPTSHSNTHHIKLSRDGQEVGLILCDSRGNADDSAITCDQYPDSTMKISQGGSDYDDSMPPFSKPTQVDWSGGRAQEVFEDDKTRYLDNWRTDPSRSGKLILAGQETYATGYRNANQKLPGSVIWRPLYGDYRALSRSFDAAASYTAKYCELLLRRKGTPTGALTVALRADATGGKPGASNLTSGSVPVAAFSANGQSQWYAEDWSYAMTEDVTYHVVVYGETTDDADNCWEIGVAESGSGLGWSSPDLSTWTETEIEMLYYRVLDAGAPATHHFFEYRRQLYFVTQPDNGGPALLYMNGYRGATDNNIGELDLIKDATQSWATGELTGCIARLIGGKAYIKDVCDWRRIVTNAATQAVVTPWWEVTQAQPTPESYVILGSNKFTLVPSASWFTEPVRSVVVVNDQAYFSLTDVAAIAYREYNNLTSWVTGTTSDTWRKIGIIADLLAANRDEYGGSVLWLSQINGTEQMESTVLATQAPVSWSTKTPSGITIDTLNAVWNEQSIPNVTVTVLEMNKMKIAVADGFATGILCSKAITPALDLRYTDLIEIRLMSDIDLAAGDLELLLDNTANCASPLALGLTLPQLKANNMTLIQLDYSAFNVTGINAVISVGLKLNVDRGVMNLTLHGVIKAYDTAEPTPVTSNSRISGLEIYGNPETCWVLTEDGIGEIRNGMYQPVPLRELATAADPNNGKAHCVGDVYLYFSFGQRGGIQRYYDQNLEGIGLDRDSGLPDGRVGPVSCLRAYAGGLLASVDGGAEGTSAVYYLNGGWHEIYRAPRVGARIREIYVQAIPGLVDRLWISMGSDVLWIPISLNPLQDTQFRYTHEGSITLSRIFVKEREIQKYWHALKLASESLGADCSVWAEYRVDGDTTWTRMPADFTVSPYQKQKLSTTEDLTGRWIDLRLHLETADNTKTPVILSAGLDVIEHQPVKLAHNLTFRLADEDITLFDNTRDTQTAREKWDLLSSWADGKPVLVNSIDALEDGKKMVLRSKALRKFRNVVLENRRTDICTCTLIEYDD